MGLFGNFTDPDSGDTHTYSWTQIKSGGEPTVSPFNPDERNTSIVTPNVDMTLRYRFTVTDSSNASDSEDIQILVAQQGGGGGGGGGGSVGTISGCSGDNQPAVASVPATYAISEGFQGEIQATNADDPDDTVGGCTAFGCSPAGVTFEWTVKDGKGLMSNSDLQDRLTSKVRFTAPQVGATTTIVLELFANDAKGCGNKYPVNVVVENGGVVNNNPDVVLTYDVQGQNITGNAPSGNIVVASPATIDLDARGSSDPDGDPITFAWQKSNQNLSSGSTVLSPSNATATLTALSGTNGSVTVTVTVSDDRGGQRAQGLTFVFVEPDDLPPDVDAGSSDILYPVWGAGPLGDGSALQTTVIIDNLSEEDVEDVRIQFYDTGGNDVDLHYIDVFDPENSPKPWDPEQPLTIAGLFSRVIEFVAPQGVAPAGTPGVLSGWALVTSTGLLRGSTRFQLINEEDGSLLEDVGIPNARPEASF